MLTTDDIIALVMAKSRLKKLTFPPVRLDHVDHIVQMSLAGAPQLAADHILHAKMRGKLQKIVGSVIRQLNFEFMRNEITQADSGELLRKKIQQRGFSYWTLIEIAMNLVGMEAKMLRFFPEEIDATYKFILETLVRWEHIEKKEKDSPVARAIVRMLIEDMKKVMGGAGMVARMGKEIEEKLDKDKLTTSFVLQAKCIFQKNVYYQMVKEGLGKFGNDYAIGLRYLRHLGYVQVSTNPVLAARAYEDDAELWEDFKEVVTAHPEWQKNPENFADEIAMEATKTALWPNLVIFRPIFLASNFQDGMVSYQLNPNVADNLEGSLRDALEIYSSAQEFLRNYDSKLLWGYSNLEERKRPNIVFKVAGGYPASIEITKKLNTIGIGTNNTVTYSVSQEVSLIIAAMEGMAASLKMGIPVTQVYETNMGGRLESHLREVEAEKLLFKAMDKVNVREIILNRLAQKLGATEELKKTSSLEEKLKMLTSYNYLKSLTNQDFVQVIADARGDECFKNDTFSFLRNLENDIGYAGTFVAQRVYTIFFSQKNKAIWLSYLEKQFGLTKTQAENIMDKIDVLPASKRKPDDTYLTLATKNMTNTEFPNHQQSVLETYLKKELNLQDFKDAILKDHNPQIRKNLLRLPDFRKAYELTPELTEQLTKVGIKDDFGTGGLKVEEWSSFGPVVKTMNEFTCAYNNFRERTIEFVHQINRSSS
ncbi:hypothetical protein IBX65_04790 [Candidatus Aerophobetes bacterium]|nr:hypothetical protein [Candidatus Aerophobetes bacterium]